MATLDNLQLKVTGDISDVTKKLDQLNKQLGEVGGKGKAKVEIEKTSESIKKVGTSAKKASPHVNKLFASIGRVAFYRAIRSALKAVTTAFKEGTDNAYAWAAANEHIFAKVMDNYATDTTYIQNSLGALASTALTSLLPALTEIVNGLVAVINKVNEFVAAISGSDTYTKARRVAVKYGDAVDDAAASQKKLNQQLMAFDELNVITTPKSGGSGSDSNAMLDAFYTDTVSDNMRGMVRYAKEIADVFKNSIPNIEDVINMLKSGVSDIVNGFIDGFTKGINIEQLKSDIETMFKNFKKVYDELKSAGVFEKIGEAVGKISALLVHITAFTTSAAFQHIMNALELIDDLLNFRVFGVFEFFIKEIFTIIYNGIKGVATLLNTVFGAGIDIAVVDNFYNGVMELVSNMNDKIANFNVYGEKFNEMSNSERTDRLALQLESSGKHWFQDERYMAMMAEEYAVGGYPNQGSLFLAGEVPGQTEMVGTVNGRTGVASGEEITGISEAVYATGNEEAGLLRELISTVRSQGGLGAPNAAFGRYVTQSLRLYKGVTG